MADVTYSRKDFEAYQVRLSLVMDVIGGRVKEKGVKYLPKPNPADQSTESLKKYDQYKARALFVNFTNRTKISLVGSAFTKKPALTTVSELDFVSSDIDGEGINIYQQSQKVLGQVVAVGRHGLLADYPAVSERKSKADEKKQNIKPRIVSIDAGLINNWRTETVDGVTRLSLVVYRSDHSEVTPDGFGESVEDQYIALRLENAMYKVEQWRESKKSKVVREWSLYDSSYPLNGMGENWKEIPFTFVGSQNNDSSIDDLPLYDLSLVNCAHYRNSADYEHNLFFAGQLQPWMSGVDENHYKLLKEEGLTVGSDSLMPVPAGEQYGIAQAEPNSTAKEGMDSKEKQMIGIGARIITPGSAVKTATEAQADNESEHSVLSLAASNVSDAYTKCLNWMEDFSSRKPKGENVYEINQDFAVGKLNSQDLLAYIAAVQGGLMPENDFFNLLKKSSAIDPEKTNEQIKEEIQAGMSGLSLDENLDNGSE